MLPAGCSATLGNAPSPIPDPLLSFSSMPGLPNEPPVWTGEVGALASPTRPMSPAWCPALSMHLPSPLLVAVPHSHPEMWGRARVQSQCASLTASILRMRMGLTCSSSSQSASRMLWWYSSSSRLFCSSSARAAWSRRPPIRLPGLCQGWADSIPSPRCCRRRTRMRWAT